MLRSKSKVQNYYHQNKNLEKQFSLLVWNIHKENQKHNFERFFLELLEQYKSDLLLLQEVQYPKQKTFFLKDYSYTLAGNIETKKNLFGVMTAAKSSFKSVLSAHSLNKEFGCITHKSFLISQHPFMNNTKLTLVNLHAINFVSNKVFEKELLHIQNTLLECDTPLIIAGDFNNWNKKRFTLLKKFQQELSLQKLEPQNSHHIKKIFSHTIDHIYYRKLKPLQALAIDTKKISDHNPIYAVFELL